MNEETAASVRRLAISAVAASVGIWSFVRSLERSDTGAFIVTGALLTMVTGSAVWMAGSARDQSDEKTIPTAVFRLAYVGVGGAILLALVAIAQRTSSRGSVPSDLSPVVALAAALLTGLPILTSSWARARAVAFGIAGVATVAGSVVVAILGFRDWLAVSQIAVVSLFVGGLVGLRRVETDGVDAVVRRDQMGTELARWTIGCTVAGSIIAVMLIIYRASPT